MLAKLLCRPGAGASERRLSKRASRGPAEESDMSIPLSASGSAVFVVAAEVLDTALPEAVDELSNDIVTYRGVSLAFLTQLAEGLVSGDLMPELKLYVAKTDSSDQVRKGDTVRFLEKVDTDHWRGLHRRGHSVVVARGDMRRKPRLTWDAEDVCVFVVLHKCAPSKCKYLDLLGEGDVGAPFQGAFLSYARRGPFARMVRALSAHYAAKGADPASTYIWVDMFAANQPLLMTDSPAPSVLREREDLFARGLHTAIASFEDRLVFWGNWRTPETLTRLWCIWEVFGAVRSGRPVEIVLAVGQDESLFDDFVNGWRKSLAALSELDAERAECFREDDRAMIESRVLLLERGFTTINEVLKDKLRAWLVASALRLANAPPKAPTAAVGDSKGHEDERSMRVQFAIFCRSTAEMLVELDMDRPGSDMDALKCARRSVDLFNQVQHRLNESMALNTVAKVLVARGDLDQAIRVCDESLALYEAVLAGEPHTILTDQVPGAHLQRAIALARQDGQERAAIQAMKGVLERFASLKDPSSSYALAGRADVANNIAVLHAKLGELDEARSQYSAALRLSEEANGADHPTTASAAANLAMCIRRMGAEATEADLEEALELASRALKIRLNTFGAKHRLSSAAEDLVADLEELVGARASSADA